MKAIPGKGFVFISCALFLLVGLILLPIYKYQINPDGIAYLSIAKHYADGRWMNALNSCWPPLYSWLIAPLLLIIDEPLWIAKFYNILSGTGCLYMSLLILRYYKVQPVLHYVAVIVFTGTYLMWTFGITTPDLLSVFIMLIYAYLVITNKVLAYPLLTGLVGAIAYFAKSYCFFFFAAHLSLNYFQYFISRKHLISALIKKYLLTIGCFLLLSFGWMWILSIKYNKITISSASAWTHGMIKYKNLQCIDQIIAPPHAYASFAWEDPPLVCAHKDWSIFSSTENFLLQTNILFGNSAWFFKLQSSTGYFHFAGFFLILFMVVMKKQGAGLRIRNWREILEDPLFTLLPFTILYTFGYLLIFIEPRYVWIGYVLITIGLMVVMDRIIHEWKIKTRTVVALLSAMALLLLVTVLIDSKRMLVPLQSLFSKETVVYKGREFYEKANQLKIQSPKDSRMACWGNADRRINRTQSWNLAYYADWRHYGMLPMDTIEAKKLVNQYDIRIITILSNDSIPDFIQNKWTLLTPEVGRLRIFKRNE